MSLTKKNLKAILSAWESLTWDDLVLWAGTKGVAKGKSYQRNVADLKISPEGNLLAWVEGTHRYATTVEILPEKKNGLQLESRCTCPVGFNACKHAVAVVLVYLDALKKKETVPQARVSDPRWKQLEGELQEWEEDELEESPEEEFNEEEPAEAPQPKRRRTKLGKVPRMERLRTILQGKSAGDLVQFTLELAERFPEVGDELLEQQALVEGDAKDLVHHARREIDELTGEPAWENEWDGSGYTPDFSNLERRFKALFQHGHFDSLLDLGNHMLRQGTDQVEQSHDEGETATAISNCLKVVLEAVPKSTLPNPKKILYVIDAVLQDEFDLVPDIDSFLERPWSQEAWSAVADELFSRLQDVPKVFRGADWSASYRRDTLTNWIIDVLDRAGREEEATRLCETEASLTGSYQRVVRRLMDRGRTDEAQQWAVKGIEQTSANLPGIANGLRDLLRELAEAKGNWPQVAAFRAEEFFMHPGIGSLDHLLKAAEQAGCVDSVRAAALRFLETGQRPVLTEPRKKGKNAWPLPPLNLPNQQAKTAPSGPPKPHFNVLLDLALAEKEPDAILRWFEALQKHDRRSPWGYFGFENYAEQVAEAIVGSHPERALAIRQQELDGYLTKANASAYEAVANQLRKMRPLFAQVGRPGEWDKLLTEIRTQHRRKRKLLETLDMLDNRAIIAGD